MEQLTNELMNFNASGKHIRKMLFNSRVREQNACLSDRLELERTESYICHLQVPGVSHPVAVINPYHPSSPAWNSNIANFDRFFTKLLEE